MDSTTDFRTPPFLAWTIEQRCALRQFANADDPQRTERTLRAIRELEVGRLEGRSFAGFCFASAAACLGVSPRELHDDDALAFREDDVASAFGGESVIDAACANCVANSFRGVSARRWVGCFGLWAWGNEVNEVAAKMFCSALNGAESLAKWYLWWRTSTWSVNQLDSFVSALDELVTTSRSCHMENSREVEEFRLAVRHASQLGLRLHTVVFPAGTVRGRDWLLDPHCEKCRAPWREGAKRCWVCGETHQPANFVKRRARGTRPYYPLSRIVGLDEARELVRRFRACSG